MCFDSPVFHRTKGIVPSFLVALLCLAVGAKASALPADYVGETVAIFETTGDANQGVAVDEQYVYAVTNRRITKMDKFTGEVSAPQLQRDEKGNR